MSKTLRYLCIWNRWRTKWGQCENSLKRGKHRTEVTEEELRPIWDSVAGANQIVESSQTTQGKDFELTRSLSKRRENHPHPFFFPLRDLCAMLLPWRYSRTEASGVAPAILINLDESLFPKAVDPSLSCLLPLDLLQFFLDPIANLGKWYEA